MAKANRKLQRGLSSVVFRLLQRENVCFLLAFWVTEIPLGRCHCLLLPPSCWKRLCPAIFKILNSCFVFSEVFQAHVAARRAGSSDLWVLCLENFWIYRKTGSCVPAGQRTGAVGGKGENLVPQERE